MSGVAQPYSRRKSPDNGQLPGFLDQEHQNIQRATNGAEGLITLPGGGRTVTDTSTYLLSNAVFNVEDFGARHGASVANATPVQNAINAAIAARNGIVYLPNPPYGLESTITIGDATHTAEGVQLISGRLAVRSTDATFKWIGAIGGDAPMLKIRNAHMGALRGISFDGANAADYCLQVVHVVGDLDVAEHWVYPECSFMAARKYNVLIGEVDGVASTGDESVQNFPHCFFRSDPLGLAATIAHVRIRSGNTLPVNFWGSQFAANTNPTRHISMDGGWANVYGAVSVGTDNVAVVMEAVLGQVPPNLCAYGWESQDTNFMRADFSATAASMQRSTVLSGVKQGSISGTPGDSIQWNYNLNGFGGLVLLGSRFNKAVNIQSANCRVWSVGTSFADSTQTFTGHPEVVDGTWSSNLAAPTHQIADGNVAIAQSNSINQFESTPVSVAVGGVIPLGTDTMSGYLWIADSEGGFAKIAIRGTGHLTVVRDDEFGIYNAASGTLNRTNVYWSAGNNRYELQNNRASTRTYRMNFMGNGG